MSKKRTIKIQSISNTQYTIEVEESMTGYQLRQYIFDNLTQSLGVLEMGLEYAGCKIQHDKALSFYKVVSGQIMTIIQRKTELDQIPGLILSYEPDPILQDPISAIMPCGHVIGRDSMTSYIRMLIKDHNYKIICPSDKPNGQKCEMEWQYAVCRKIGVFKQEEANQFETGLSNNWIRSQTVQCPRCHLNLYKGSLKSNRVRCPKCNYGDFCCACLKAWNSGGFDECGNSDCKLLKDLLQKCPLDRKFNLTENGIPKQIFGPKYRVCPKCQALIQHDGGCKHMTCKKCSLNFCWICLEIKDKEVWKCGSFRTYCGKVAQTQKLKKQS